MSGGVRVSVGAAAHRYEVRIQAGALARAAAWVREACPAASYALISDSNVAERYASPLAAALRQAGAPVISLTVPAGEESKSRPRWAELTDGMLAEGIGRDGAVVGVGGGVVGDLSGFVAATFMRGIPHIQIPTSLLAMIDASVGGKTGVDTPAGKNLVGAFHPPRGVLIDPEALLTLEDRHLRAGLAEAVKHGAIADSEYLDGISRDTPRLLAREADRLARLVERSVRLKAEVVSADEHEAGRRRILNFGHTLAHAVEHVSRFRVLHGEAVAMGLVAEARIGERLGVTEVGAAERLAQVLAQLGLPTELEGAPDALLAATAIDKKARGGRVEYVLLRRVGEVARSGAGEWSVPVEEGVVRSVLAGEGRRP